MTDQTIWLVIACLAAGSFLLRFSFLGIIGNRPLPEWVERHLRYVGIGVLPALVAPLVVWPAATEGLFDPPRAIAALAALAIGIWSRHVLLAAIAGFATLYTALLLF